MSFRYDAPASGALLQGEILGDVWEHRARYPAIESPPGLSIPFESEQHPLVVVMSSVCDLERDFEQLFPTSDPWDSYDPAGESRVAAAGVKTYYCFLCDVYDEARIRSQSTVKGSDNWRRIKGNQDERYHRFEPTTIGENGTRELPDLYLDFRRGFALPSQALYAGIRAGGIERVAVIPPVFIHDLMHRFYSYHSRVGVPGE
jgi:hypothetical protein